MINLVIIILINLIYIYIYHLSNNNSMTIRDRSRENALKFVYCMTYILGNICSCIKQVCASNQVQPEETIEYN